MHMQVVIFAPLFGIGYSDQSFLELQSNGHSPILLWSILRISKIFYELNILLDVNGCIITCYTETDSG